MNKNKKISKTFLITLLVISQIYFSVAVGNHFEIGDEKSLTGKETYLVNAFAFYNSEANLNYKTLSAKKILSVIKLFDDKFCIIVFKPEKSLLLFSLNREENRVYKLSAILEKTNPRSPPLT